MFIIYCYDRGGKIDRCEPNQEPDKKWGQTKHSFEIR